MAIKTVPKNAEGGKAWYYRNGGFPASPGDVIELQGDYDYIEIRNLSGTPDKYIEFKGTGLNRAGFNAANAVIFANCHYIKFNGIIIGPDDGKFAEQGFNMQGSSNMEISRCILQNAKVGFFNNTSKGHFPNVFIHHNTIRNISDPAKSNFCEAFYLGNTNGLPATENSHANLRIEDNTLVDIGGDGIQIANGINVSVKRNSITNYGFHNINDQWFGILCGGGTSGVFADNVLSKGTGTPFQILGTGDVTFSNNTAIGCATGDKQDGFYIRQSFPTLKVRLLNNKIDKVNRNWITQVTPGLVVEDKGNLFGVTVPPVDPHAGYVPQAQYDAIVEQLRVANLQLKNLEQINIDLVAWKQQTIEFVNRRP